jgi:iron complex outermembrane receptor protein
MKACRSRCLSGRLGALAILLVLSSPLSGWAQDTEGPAEADPSAEAAAESAAEADVPPESAAAEEDDPVLEDAEEEEPAVVRATKGIETIKVTARRREESIQDTPISMTVFDEEALAERGIQDIRELARFTPNLIFDASPAQSNNAQVFIRGIGQTEGTINAEPKVGIYIDGIYQARPLGSIISLFDLERIEVLRGPQGTLYGKNAIGGAINIISNKPQPHPEATVQVEFGNLGSKNVRLMGNMPVDVFGLGDMLFARADFLYESRDGYIDDLNFGKDFGDHDLLGGRGALRFTPLENLDMNLSYTQTSQPTLGTRGECAILASRTDAKFYEAVADPAGMGALGGDFVEECELSSGLTTSTNVPAKDDLDTMKIHGDLVWDSPEIPGVGGLVVRSISGYQTLDRDLNLDFDSTSLPVLEGVVRGDHHWQFSQELVVSGAAFDERLRWTAGLFYLREEFDGPLNDASTIIPEFEFFKDTGNYWPLGAEIDTSSGFLHQTAAGYLFGTFDVSEVVTMNAGVRYAWEKKDFDTDRFLTICGFHPNSVPPWSDCSIPWNPTPDGDIEIGPGPVVVVPASTIASTSDQWQAPTGNIGVGWAVRDNLNLYVGYQRGFTSGGFNFLGDDENGVPNRFEPEFLDGVEFGVKSTWLEGRLVANATYFWSYYHDRQQRVQEARNLEGEGNLIGFADVIINVGDATIQGGEFEFSYLPVDGLLLRAGVGLTFAEYDELFLLDRDATDDASLPDGTIVEVYDDATSNAFPYTPKVNFSVGAMYSWAATEQFEITPSVDFAWRSKVYFDVANTPELSQDGYGLLNARLSIRHRGWNTELALWGKNLTDELYRTGGFSLQNYASRYYGISRTFGVTLTQRFSSD